MVQMIQLIFFHDRVKFSVNLQKSLRLDEPIVSAFQSHMCDQSVNKLFTSQSCTTLSDILTHFSAEDGNGFRYLS